MTRAGKKLADSLLQQLYVWIEQEPSLAVYAAPFDPNPQENSRRLKVYRNMHGADSQNIDARTQLAAVLASKYYDRRQTHSLFADDQARSWRASASICRCRIYRESLHLRHQESLA